MKLIVRADDFGYTPAYNMGTEKAITEGIVTSVDLMLDCPGFFDAVERIKKYPWISIGWHAHFWGSPVLPPEQVPSMVNREGRFKFRKDSTLRDECSYDEIVAECRAQVERCIQLLGRAPDYTSGAVKMGRFEQARHQVCDEYGIKYGFCTKPGREPGSWAELPKPEYEALDIYMVNQPATVYKPCTSPLHAERMAYNPVQYYLDNSDRMLERNIVITAWHPGYLDDYILSESSFTEARPIDVKALCSPVLRQWIRDNQVELINFRDALFGTRQYQNHLKQIGSDLYISD